MYVAFLWILAERVKKHDPVLHISRSLFLHHILVMFYFYMNLRESGLGNMSLRTHIRGSFSKVSKYLLSLLWAKRCTRHSGHSKRSLPPNFVLFFFFKKKKKLNGSSNSSSLFHQVPPMLDSFPKCIYLLLSFVNVEFYVALCNSHYRPVKKWGQKWGHAMT